jgi:phthalate 4,5-dioxygenase oxygenase subunit
MGEGMTEGNSFMMTQEENELLSRTVRGTPGGDLLRRYWQPVALSEELPSESAPLSIKILGEDLVLFRDDKGRAGLLGIHCSHRGTDLSYGRVEDGGLRCLYHGWLYDVEGRCLQQPGEPGGGEHRDAIRHPAYPCQETGGVIFTYMGPGTPPLLPNYEFLSAPPERLYVNKIFHECNYLQANEGNIDPVHLSFLHRFLENRDERYRGVRGAEESHYNLVARNIAPILDVELTDFGVRIYTVRRLEGDKAYLRVSYFILPNLSAFPGQTGGEGYSVNWHVPIDDDRHWKYTFVYSARAPLDKKMVNRERSELTPDYRLVRNEANRFMQDRESMKSKTYAGMGSGFQAHDAFATASQGAIQDRTEEHLVSSDKAIIAARKLLEKAIRDVQEGREPPHVIREPSQNRVPHLLVISDMISVVGDWKEYTRKLEAEARAKL